jgi:hypothetical protein
MDFEIEMKNDNIQPTQLEMKEILIAKISKYNNVDIKSKEVTNNVGQYFAITAHIKLSDIGNCVFHSATLKTVSYNKRIVNIKCVFSDNENLKHDMKVNRDSLFQCFRDIAPDTITSISLEDFKDQSETSHLRIIASTIKGASLIYIYKRLMDFVKIINEKYGNLVNTPITSDPLEKYIEIEKPVVVNIPESVQLPIQLPVPVPVQLPIQLPIQLPVQTQIPVSVPVSVPTPVLNNNVNINFTISENIIKELNEEEKKLQAILDNIRILKQTHIDYIKSSNSNSLYNTMPIPMPIPIPNTIQKIESTPIPTVQLEPTQVPILASIPITFASKVKQSLKV